MAFFDDLPAQDLAFTGGRARKEEEEGPGLIRGAGDSALALGQGVVTGVKMMSDAAGAGNDFSAFLGEAKKYLESLESDQRQAEKQRIGELIKQAEASGSPSAEIAAYLAHFTNAPLDTILNAAGTAVPTIGAATVGTALTGGAAIPAAALAIGTGAVQGAGVVKGAIYDRVKEDLTKQGLPPEEVEARAQEAQSYGGENKWLIAGGAGLGAVAGRFGVEGSLIGRMAGTSSPNVLRRAVGTGATEAGPEGFQGGQEQYASNIAAQREGIDTPTWRGVAGSAALEAVAGGGLGTVAGAVMPPRAPVQEEPPGPLMRAAEIAAGVEAGMAAAGAAPTVAPPSNTAGPVSMAGVPDSVFSAFPDLTPADSGLIPLHQFTKDEQDALRAAGLVQTGNLESGEQHEGVDPERLWPERQRRATAAAANRAGVSEEDRASGIEKRARMYERLAEEQEALGDLGDQAKAAEYRNKAAAIRSGESIRQPSAAEIAAGVEAGAAAAGGSDPTAQAGTQDQAPERSGNLAGPRSAELALAAMQQQADADIAGLRVRGERVQGEPSNPIVYTEPNPTLPEAGFNPREGSVGALFEDIEEATFNAVSDADRLRAAARTDERTEAERLPATTQTARMLDDNTIDGDALVRTVETVKADEPDFAEHTDRASQAFQKAPDLTLQVLRDDRIDHAEEAQILDAIARGANARGTWKRLANEAGERQATARPEAAGLLPSPGRPSGTDAKAEIEVGAAQSEEVGGETAAQEGEESAPPLRIEAVSDKAIIVVGDTKPHKDAIKAAGGRWNTARKGWIFPKSREAQVRQALADLLGGGNAQQPKSDTAVAPQGVRGQGGVAPGDGEAGAGVRVGAGRDGDVAGAGRPDAGGQPTEPVRDGQPERNAALKKPKRTRQQAAADRKAQQAARDPFLDFLGRFGVSQRHQKDITGETGRPGNRMIPYHGPMFRKNGLPLDILAQYAVERGFLTQADIDSDTDTGGTRKLADMIRRAHGREAVGTTFDEQARTESRMEEESEAQLFAHAAALGVDTQGMSSDDVLAYLDEHEETLIADKANRLIDAAIADWQESGDPDVAMPDEGMFDEAVRTQWAAEIDPDAVERAATRYPDDDVGFLLSIEEIIREKGREKPARPGEDGRQGAAVQGRDGEEAQAGRGRDAPAQEEGREGFGLTAPTPDEIRRQTQEQERAQQQARQRDQAPPAEEFTLTGSSRPADEAAARGQMELGGEAPVDAAAAQAATSPKNDTREPSMTPDEAARYLKDIVYSLSNLDGMTDRAAIILGTGPLAKSGRDRLLMDAFGLTRDQAHEINNRLDSRQPKSLRNEDMQEAFTIFPGLRKVVDDALAEAKPRETRQRITPDAAANMRPGDIIVDEQGREYRAHRARGEFLDAHPIVDGKANVSADTTVRFHLNPETAGAHPDRQAGPVYATGRSLNAQDRQGLTEADRYAQKVDPAAAELAGQFIEETKDGDYDGLMATVEQWAKDADVAADDLRQAVLKNIDRLDAPAKQKNAIRLALNPVRAAKQAEKPAADEMLDEARRVAKDGRQGKLKQSLLKSAIERAEAGEIGDLAARLAASKAEIEKQAKKSATEEDANEAELERSAQAIASADSVRVIERKLRDLKESRGKGTSSDLAWGTAGGGNYIRDLRILERALEIAKGEKPAGPIKDVGEQLYANRRNFVGRGLKWDDLAGMNDTLKVKEVKKAKVWPKPDYEKLIAEGMPTVLARMVKQVYDGLGAGPTIRGTPTDADLKRYIDTIGKVREAIFGFTQDKEAVTKFANGVQAIIDRERQSGGVPLMSVMQDAKALADTLLARIWPEEMAKPTSGRFRRGSDANAEALVIGGNRALRALQFDRDDLTKWAKEVAAGWPAKREAWQVQGYRVIAPGDYVVSDEKEVTRYNRQTGEREATGETYFPVAVKGMRRSWMTPTRPAEGAYLLINENGGGLRAFDSEDAAIEAAREITKREKGVGQDNRGTNVSESERTGPARREEGENISSERFKEVFGFRGVNFGREGWIKQAERQEYLNAAYDGLLDLAEILNVPPLAMSLDGMLGIAFGAQGKGQYAAHFVPGHNEINLTKTRGAGSLAHEWGHALDHYFATQAGLAKDDEPMVSEHAHKPDVQERIVRIADRKAVTEKVPTFGDGIRPEIVRAFRSIVQAMEKRPEAESEAASRDELAIAEARRKTDGWLKSVRRHIANMNIGERDALLAEFDGHAAAILEGDTGDGHVSSGKIAVLGRVAAIRDLVKRATGRLLSKDESEGLDLNARFLRNLIAKKGASDTHEPQRMVATDYARESADLDRRKSKSGKKRYWSTPTEMFARAFETYVHERLAAQGQVNTFLTDAEERSRAMIDVPDNSSAMTRGAGQTKQIPAYPYPRGVERETINKAFDTLIGEIKTRPGEKGVAMFSRGDGTGMPIENVTRLAAAVKKAWANAPEVVVVADMADPKIPAEVRDADAEMRASGAEGEPEGFFYGGKVYLVAGALDSPADVVRVLAHESLGHYGLRGLFGDRLMGILAQVANDRPREVAAKMREYGLSGAEGRLQAAEEVLAVMAQTNPKLGFVKRAIAAIRSWLRGIGVNLRTTDNDIVAQFIIPARAWVQRGGKAGTGTPAFSLSQTRSDVSPIGFYSELARKIEAGPGRADAANWKSFIRSQKGIKPDEIAWSGIEEFLDLQPGKITNEAVREFLAANGVRVDETVLGGQPDYVDEAGTEWPTSPDENPPKFAAYTIPGGTNYREVLLTLPAKRSNPVADLDALGYTATLDTTGAIYTVRRKNDGELFFNPEDVEEGGRSFNDLPADARTIALGRVREDAGLFRSSHWDQPNVLAHVRIDERTDADGKRVLFVNEIQSDWAQKGRKEGFDSKPSADPLEQRPFGAVPAAPFVEKTEAWVALALKRIIRMAAEEGFDRVAIIRGEQAADLFDLSKQVDRIAVTPTGGVWAVTAWKDGTRVISKDARNESELAELVGKEIAERAINEGGGDYTGLELKVGGKGMLSFYDRIVPTVLKDVLKKVGGPAPATVMLPAPGGTGRTMEVSSPLGGRSTIAIADEPPMNQVGFDITPQMRETVLGQGVPMFSRAVMGQRQKIVDGIADLYKSSKGFNWWHKTLGTQYEKADRNPYFRRAFEAAQSFLNDVSDFANRAADLAPSLLPKMNGIRDVLKRPVPKKDVDAIARPIFDGTLYDSDPAKGKVWSDDELRDTYGLNQKQIDLYREFRAAVDKSLDDMGKTDLIRYVGKDADPVRDQVREAGSISAAAEILAAHLEQLAQDNPKGSHAETAATVRRKAERIEGLKAGGYAPLMRFGRFSVYVTRQDEDGAPEQVYFGMFETQREANRMARQFRDDPTYADAEVTQGVMSQEAFKLFQGVNPDTLELFADVAGIEQTELFQTYLKLAKSNRSAMKRLINRKGVAGFSDDVTRVLASFITSNSRAAAANMNVSEMNAAASEVPKEQGDVKDEAVRLVEFVRGTNDPSSKLRGLLFMQYLGGSVASALVNMTQPLTMTYPYLAQFSGAAKAGAILTKAVKDAVTGVGSDRDLSRALKQAESEGIVSPQEIHHLYSEAGIGLGRNTAIRRATFAWGSMFSAAEQFNRRATFIAAYRIAREQGISDPYKFAEKAVVETQGIYCVDEETECLTAAGWKRHTDLDPGEMLYAVDDDGNLVESRLVDVHRFSRPGGIEATALQSGIGLSMVYTDEHNCLVQSYSSRDKKWSRVRRVKAKDVKNSQFFVRTPLGDATGREPVYTDDEVRLFAWIAAEGHLFAHRNVKEKRGVGLVQSQSHNPEYVAEIDALLDRLGGHYNRKINRSNDGMVCWQLRKPLWSKIHEALPGKLITFGLVSKLTVPQMRIFLDTFAKGDGHMGETGGWVIAQKDEGNLNAMQAMAVLSGQSSAIGMKGGRSWGTLYLSKNGKRAFRKEMTAERVRIATAWCPETEHGTWIARRNGRTFVTGNSRANRSNWARNPVGATLLTFKQFMIAYLEFLKRLPPKERALAMAVLILVAGLEELPFADDAEDVVDTVAQALGYNWNTARAKREWLAGLLGHQGSEFVLNGLSAVHGMPIDVSARLGLGNLIPGTGLLLGSTRDKSREITEVLGAGGSFAQSVLDAGGALLSGDVRKAGEAVAPLAVRNALKGIDMYQTGMYRDTKGRRVMDVDGYDALVKAIGFQPAEVAAKQRKASIVYESVALVKNVEGRIAERWARGVFERDAGAIKAARDELRAWNRTNPEARISIEQSQINRRVRAMRATRAERLAGTAPREIRQAVKESL